jgi:Sec20
MKNGVSLGSRQKKTGSSSTASEAQSIQHSLQRTQNLLKNELDRVTQVATTIDEDGKLLEDTKNEFQSLNVGAAKKALTSLQRAQQREQRVLTASILFFFSVVFYIMWQRVLIKLPLVDRVVKMALALCQHAWGQGTGHVTVTLQFANVWGMEAFTMAQEKIQELIHQVQTLIKIKM